MKPIFFVGRFSKLAAEISGFIKFRPVGPDLFHEDRQADITKLVVIFHTFAKALKTA